MEIEKLVVSSFWVSAHSNTAWVNLFKYVLDHPELRKGNESEEERRERVRDLYLQS